MGNFGAQRSDGRNFQSKKAFREAVANGDSMIIYDTSAFNNLGHVSISELSPIDVIVGPDPYTARNWYANVKNGKVV